MKHNKFFIAFALASSAALVGCGGDDGDDVTIIVDGGMATPTPVASPTPSNACATVNVVEADFVTFNATCTAATVSGVIGQDYEFINEIEWRLDGEVIVGEGNASVANDAEVQAVKDAGVTLTIEAGTEIKAFATGSLLVTRGSSLMAEGTATAPITFSSIDTDFDGLGEWGGVIIQGFAPQYGAGGTGGCFGPDITAPDAVCNVIGEGGTIVGNYGGDDEADNSGVLRYVRIAEGGLVAGPNNEINGLTLQGVGYGTVIEYIHVHNNLDDGIEWFGGTVNAKYVVLTGNDDDDLDYDEGYRGNIQYAILQKDALKAAPTGSNDPRGIEANSSDADFVPETSAVLANVTVVGGPVNNVEGSQQPGMRLRGAVTTEIYNSAVKGYDTGCIRVDDANTDGVAGIEEVSVVNLTNILADCEDGIYDRRDADSATNVVSTPFTFKSSYAIQQDAANLASAPAIVALDNGSGFMFDQTDYIGAVDPDETIGWWEGWTILGALEPSNAVETSFSSCNAALTVCTLSGTIDEDYTLVRGVDWKLDGEVLVGDGNIQVNSDVAVQAIKDAGVTLTIDAGVHVRALSTGSLLVTRGSKLDALGTVSAPITFSSDADADFDGLGEWGGIIIQGFAPQYGAGGTGGCFGSDIAAADAVCNVIGEGGTVVGNYGGDDAADNSGTIRYVRIAEGGLVAGPNNEINGLTLQGVGHGTTIEYVQVHNNLDDGVEWFGGTVNVKYLVLTGNDDDDIDFDEGYQGNIQYAIIRKDPLKATPTGSNDPRGIEANSSDADYVPETEATLANILVLGGPANNVAAGQQPGMRLRGALTVSIYNTAVNGFDTGCIRIDDANTDGNSANGNEEVSNVTLTNILGDCVDGFYDRRDADTATNAVVNAFVVDAAYAISNAEGSVASTDPVETDNGSGFVFDNTTYVGAVAPGTVAADAWWAGWIIDGSLD